MGKVPKGIAGVFMLAACLCSGALAYNQARVGNASNTAMAGMSTIMWGTAGALTLGLKRDD